MEFLKLFLCKSTTSILCQDLVQLCPTRGPAEGFVRLCLGFRCSISNLHTDIPVLILVILN